MRKILSWAYLAILFPWASAQEEEKGVPDFRPAQVAPTTNVVVPADSASRPPDGMTSDLPVALDESVSLNKIYTFRNDRSLQTTGNPMLDYEKKYWDHGAILQKEIQGKQGNIFVINWNNDGKPADFMVRVDYRQANTRERVMTKVERYENFDGYEKTVIKVVGDDYLRGGVVNSWRISIVRDGKIVAQEKSFIW
ncbi:MAG: hypothetical protein FJ411_03840 [Verrucomicrobia bacterium]|nr:hypothetical protein [Verrucomicrobiota bacterium]